MSAATKSRPLGRKVLVRPAKQLRLRTVSATRPALARRPLLAAHPAGTTVSRQSQS